MQQCEKVCQLLATGQWFSPVSSTNKTDRHFITEILLKVALNTITQPLTVYRNQYPIISSFITRFVRSLTRQVPLVEQVLLTVPEHLRSHPGYSGVSVVQSLVSCVVFSRSSFVLCHLVIVSPILLPLTAFDYPFGIFTLYFVNKFCAKLNRSNKRFRLKIYLFRRQK